MEIERKFTVKKLPQNLEQYEKRLIEQGYLSTSPVVRIRRSNEEYVLTYKSKMGIEKSEIAIKTQEVELPLTKESYEHLREKVDDNIIVKTRYIIPIQDGLKIELDIFEGKLSGLYFAEVEFPDEETAKEFVPPEWFLEDVSFDKRFRNTFLSKVDSMEQLQ